MPARCATQQVTEIARRRPPTGNRPIEPVIDAASVINDTCFRTSADTISAVADGERRNALMSACNSLQSPVLTDEAPVNEDTFDDGTSSLDDEHSDNDAVDENDSDDAEVKQGLKNVHTVEKDIDMLLRYYPCFPHLHNVSSEFVSLERLQIAVLQVSQVIIISTAI